jgi:hypothetical protein
VTLVSSHLDGEISIVTRCRDDLYMTVRFRRSGLLDEPAGHHLILLNGTICLKLLVKAVANCTQGLCSSLVCQRMLLSVPSLAIMGSPPLIRACSYLEAGQRSRPRSGTTGRLLTRSAKAQVGGRLR